MDVCLNVSSSGSHRESCLASLRGGLAELEARGAQYLSALQDDLASKLQGPNYASTLQGPNDASSGAAANGLGAPKEPAEVPDELPVEAAEVAKAEQEEKGAFGLGSLAAGSVVAGSGEEDRLEPMSPNDEVRLTMDQDEYSDEVVDDDDDDDGGVWEDMGLTGDQGDCDKDGGGEGEDDKGRNALSLSASALVADVAAQTAGSGAGRAAAPGGKAVTLDTVPLGVPSPGEALRAGLGLLAALVTATLQATQAILAWRTTLWRPRPFPWRGLPNYAEKMARDMDALLMVRGNGPVLRNLQAQHGPFIWQRRSRPVCLHCAASCSPLATTDFHLAPSAQDPATAAPLSRLLGSVESEAVLALLLPSHGALFRAAPPSNYPHAVASFTRAPEAPPAGPWALGVASDPAADPAAALALDASGFGGPSGFSASAFGEGAGNDGAQRSGGCGGANGGFGGCGSTTEGFTGICWRAAQVLAMEPTVQQQVSLEAASRAAAGTFVPVLKPSLDFAFDLVTGGGDFGLPRGTAAARTGGPGSAAEGVQEGKASSPTSLAASVGGGSVRLDPDDDGRKDDCNDGGDSVGARSAGGGSAASVASSGGSSLSALAAAHRRLLHPLTPPAAALDLPMLGTSAAWPWTAPPGGNALYASQLRQQPAAWALGVNLSAPHVLAALAPSKAGALALHAGLGGGGGSGAAGSPSGSMRLMGGVLPPLRGAFPAGHGSCSTTEAGESATKESAARESDSFGADGSYDDYDDDEDSDEVRGEGDDDMAAQQGKQGQRSREPSGESAEVRGGGGGESSPQAFTVATLVEAFRGDPVLLRDLQRRLPRAASDGIHDAAAAMAAELLGCQGNGEDDDGDDDEDTGSGGMFGAAALCAALRRVTALHCPASGAGVSEQRCGTVAAAFEVDGDGLVDGVDAGDFARALLVFAWVEDGGSEGAEAARSALGAHGRKERLTVAAEGPEGSARGVRVAEAKEAEGGRRRRRRRSRARLAVAKGRPRDAAMQISTDASGGVVMVEVTRYKAKDKKPRALPAVPPSDALALQPSASGDGCASIASVEQVYEGTFPLPSSSHGGQQDFDDLSVGSSSSSSSSSAASDGNAPRELEESDGDAVNGLMPGAWEAHWSEEYTRFYFYDPDTDETVWESPVPIDAVALCGEDSPEQRVAKEAAKAAAKAERRAEKDAARAEARAAAAEARLTPRTRSAQTQGAILDTVKSLENTVATLRAEQAANAAQLAAAQEAALAERQKLEAAAAAQAEAAAKEAAAAVAQEAARAAAEAADLERAPRPSKVPQNLKTAEVEFIVQEYSKHFVRGLNLRVFEGAVAKVMVDCPGSEFGPSDVPREKDLKKAFEMADTDKSGVVDIDEFVQLYSKIKAGEIDGLAGYGFFESKKKPKRV